MLRIAICQAALPRYRVPAFNLLGRQPDVELTVLVGSAPGPGETHGGIDGFEIELAPTRQVVTRLGPICFQAGQLRALASGRFDLLVLPWDVHYASLPVLLALAPARDATIVLWGHGVSKAPRAARTAIRNRLGRWADGVLLYTRTVADELVGRHGFRSDRVFVAQNALDQAPIQAARSHWLSDLPALERFRAEHGLEPSKTAIAVSRLVAANQMDRLIRGLASVRVRHPRARLVIVGDGPERHRLEGLADAHGLARAVVFTGALYDEVKIAPWMLSACMFTYPTNMGLGLLHAFGYGLPVLTGDRLGRHGPEIEALHPGQSGLLFRHEQEDALVEQWCRLLDSPAFTRALGAHARRSVLGRYTLANLVQGFLDTTRLVDGVRRRVVAH